MPSKCIAVLGIGGSSHDFSAALIINGKLVVAIEDERLDRVRHGSQAWHNEPAKKSVEYCLSAAGLKLSDLTAIYSNVDIESPREYGITPKPIQHHLAHAAASFYPSTFKKAALLVIDGHGGPLSRGDKYFVVETISTGVADRTRLDLAPLQTGRKKLTSGTWHYIAENSLGSFYKVVTDAIGFGMRGQGKTMGLAPYGDDSLRHEMSQFVMVDGDGRFIFDPYAGLYDWLNQKLSVSRNKFQVRANIAAATQIIFEEAVIRIAKVVHKKTGLSYLCYGGGCALNGSANYRLLKETPFKSLYIYPASGDNGLAVGAAMYGYCQENQGGIAPAPHSLSSDAYKGRPYTGEECIAALSEMPVAYRHVPDSAPELAGRLAHGQVVAIFRGGSEIGPRALGNRSILADPRSTALRDKINISIKGRETFRPLAPIVNTQIAPRYFDLVGPSPFMLLIAPVRAEFRSLLEGICHVDGTARLQTIDDHANPFIIQLLEEFGALTGVPVLTNTSFNAQGEPIVETPLDALRCFVEKPIDVLLLEEYIVEKHTPWVRRSAVVEV